MTGTESYKEATAPAGTGLYYASLFIKPARRPQVLALYALENELLRSLSVQDPGVARLRLQWWIEEIGQAQSGAARHPITRELQPWLQNGQIDGTLLIQAIEGIEAELVATDRDTFEAILEQYRQHFGPMWRLAAALCAVDNTAALEAAETLGALHHLGRDLQALPRNLGRGFSRPIPRRELETAGLSPDPPAGEAAQAWRDLLIHQFQRLQADLDQAIAGFPARSAVQAEHCLILARLDATLCAEIRRDGCKIFDRQYALTPLRKFWLAWRTHRQLLRRTRRH